MPFGNSETMLGARLASLLFLVAALVFCRPAPGQANNSAATDACPAAIQESALDAAFSGLKGIEFQVTLEGAKGVVLLPQNFPAGGKLQWVWFAPKLAGQPNLHHFFLLQKLLSAGMAFAAVDVGESYGSPAGTRLYTMFHDLVTKCFLLSQKAVLLPQSRGGLMLFNWAVLHPDQVERIAGIYPVCDLRSYPGLETAAKAYGMTVSELETDLPAHNPIDFAATLAARKIPVLLILGDSDKVVPLDKNSGEFISRYKQSGGPGYLIVVPGKGHEEISEFFQSEAFAAFLTAATLPAQ